MKSKRNNENGTESPPAAELRVQIETRAYQIWIAGGGGHGSDLQHWLQAEAEILKASQKTQPTSEQ